MQPMAADPRARRDAVTVEISYAVVSGALLAALVYFAVVAPTWVWELSGGTAGALKAVASVCAALAFAARAATLLVRLRAALKSTAARR